VIVFHDIGQAYLNTDGLFIPRSVVSAWQDPEQATYLAQRHYTVRLCAQQELCALDSSEPSMSDSEEGGSDSEGCRGARSLNER